MLRRTVRQNLAYPLQLLGHNKNEIETEVMDWVGRVGLNGVLDHSCSALVGRRKAKARPCTGLDPQAESTVLG